MGIFDFLKKKESHGKLAPPQQPALEKSLAEPEHAPKIRPQHVPQKPQFPQNSGPTAKPNFKPNVPEQTSTIVEDKKSSYEIPDFSEDDLDFNLDINEFLPQDEQNDAVLAAQSIENLENTNKSNLFEEDYSDMPNKEELEEVFGNSQNVKNEAIENQENTSNNLTGKTNASENISGESDISISSDDNFSSFAQEKPELAKSIHIDDAKINIEEDDLPEFKTGVPIHLTENTTSAEQKISEAIDAATTPSETTAMKMPKVEFNVFIEKEEYKKLLMQEEEMLHEVILDREITNKFNEFAIEESNIFKSLIITIGGIKDTLLSLDASMFEKA